jgi:hypothetical protein
MVLGNERPETTAGDRLNLQPRRVNSLITNVNGWAVLADGRLRLTAVGWLRLDALVSRVPLS